MTIENVSIWLMANFGANYVNFLAMPIIVFVALTLVSKLTNDKREFMKKEENKGANAIGFVFGFIVGFCLLFALNYAAFRYGNLNLVPDLIL